MTLSSRRLARPLLITALFACAVGCDQGTKLAVVAHLTVADGGGSALERFLWQRHPQPSAAVTVINGLWDLCYVENPGASWSLGRGLPPRVRLPLLLAMAVAGMVLVGVYFARTPREKNWQRLGLTLVGAGALGNLLDRARLGYVIDWVHWHWYDRFDWPVFNVADACISVGVALLLAQALLDRRRRTAS